MISSADTRRWRLLKLGCIYQIILGTFPQVSSKLQYQDNEMMLGLVARITFYVCVYVWLSSATRRLINTTWVANVLHHSCSPPRAEPLPCLSYLQVFTSLSCLQNRSPNLRVCHFASPVVPPHIAFSLVPQRRTSRLNLNCMSFIYEYVLCSCPFPQNKVQSWIVRIFARLYRIYLSFL